MDGLVDNMGTKISMEQIINNIVSLQGSNLKKILSRLLATIDEKMVAKCKNAVAR